MNRRNVLGNGHEERPSLSPQQEEKTKKKSMSVAVLPTPQLHGLQQPQDEEGFVMQPQDVLDLTKEDDVVPTDKEEAVMAEKKTAVWEDTEDDDDDSDYVPEHDEEEDDDVEEQDDDAYLASLQMELDDSADEVKDYYLKRMLAARDRMDSEDAAWVERYVQAQEQWKQQYGTSIDEIDLDLRLAGWEPTSNGCKRKQSSGFWRMWQGRVVPWLPRRWQEHQRQELVVAVCGTALFVMVAVLIQCYVLVQQRQSSRLPWLLP